MQPMQCSSLSLRSNMTTESSIRKGYDNVSKQLDIRTEVDYSFNRSMYDIIYQHQRLNVRFFKLSVKKLTTEVLRQKVPAGSNVFISKSIHTGE